MPKIEIAGELSVDTLQTAEARYKALFERSLVMIYLHDFAGNFLDANDAALNALGYSRAELSSINFAGLLSEDQSNKAFNTLKELKETGSQKTITEYQLRKKDGSFIWVETEAALIYRNGKPYAIQGIARNITEQKLELKRAEEQFRILFEQSPASITLVDTFGKVLDCNTATEKLVGYPKEAICGKAFIDLLTLAPEDLPELIKQYEMLKNDRETTPLDLRIRRKNGEIRWVNVITAPLKKDAKIIKLQNIATDITDRKMAEEQLKHANDELNKLNRLKEEFYADIAHEYRTPLIAIRGFVELLLQSTSLTEVQKGDLEIVLRNEHRLEQLINNMLEYSHLESGRISLKKDKFRVSEICTELRKDLFPLVAEKHLEIVETIQPDDEVLLDRHYITNVIKNLLTNAIKFSFPNGQIIIHSSVLDGVWIFSMRDFGIGIAKEEISQLFERFVKLKASEMMNPNGIGIGLTICQKLINAYGGKIWAESEGLNTGATFTFQIKLC